MKMRNSRQLGALSAGLWLGGLLWLFVVAVAGEEGAGGESLIVDAAWVEARSESVLLRIGPGGDGETSLAGLSWNPPGAMASVDEVRSQLGAMGLSGAELLVLDGEDIFGVALAFWWLERAGCETVRVLGEALEASPGVEDIVGGSTASRQPTAFVGSGARAGLAAMTLRELHASLGQRGFEMLDGRDGVDWAAERYEAPPAFRSGHVPGALPFDLSVLLPEGGGWPEPAAIRRRMSRTGPRPSTRVSLESTFALYGEGPEDLRSMLGYVLLRLAGIEGRVVASGWSGWVGEEYPVVRIVEAHEVAALLELENPGLEADRPAKNLILFDNRGEGAHSEAHVPGATSLRAEIFLEELEDMVARGWPGVDRDEVTMIFYCYGRDCVRARYCSTVAAQAGFRNLYWFREGMPGWLAAELPVFP